MNRNRFVPPAPPLPHSLAPLFLYLLFFMIGCVATTAEPAPTLVPLAAAPDLPPPTDTLVVPNMAEVVVETAVPAITLTPTLAVPTPEGAGVRPDQVQQQFVPDAGPAAPADWRPPPYDVPLSINPDDHYWLKRPLPSNRRNYDLEWYPFGNDVLIPELAPYRIHHGVDFPNDRGTTILAAGSGTVLYAGPLPSPRNGVNYYGNTVVIQHDWQWRGQNVYTLYAHTLELFVEAGDYVETGELIAGVGSSGEVSGSHLHLEVRVGENNYGATRNPALWLAPYEGWGTIAGRLVDSLGRMIPGALITVKSVDVDAPARVQRTYSLSVRSDDVWRENFAVGDLPAGRYTVLLTVNDVTYERDMRVLPGQTSFTIVSTNFEFVPTATPIPTATPEATGESEESEETEPTFTPEA